MRRIILWIAGAQTILAGLVFTLLITSAGDARRYGDNLQVALPVLALACEASRGAAGEFALRFAAMMTLAHGTKRGLGEARANRRPDGGRHGFPSAHTAAATLGASALAHSCLRAAPNVRVAVILAAGFVGASRIQVGAHDIWQVLAGALLGLGCDRLVRREGPVRDRLRRGRDALSAGSGPAGAGKALGDVPSSRSAWLAPARPGFGQLGSGRRRPYGAKASARTSAAASRGPGCIGGGSGAMTGGACTRIDQEMTVTAFRLTCVSPALLPSALLPAVLLPTALLLAAPAGAETELSLYTGRQIVSDSTVSGSDPGGVGAFDFRTSWSGDSFKAPPYYGARAIWWRADGWGWGIDANHVKATADAGTRAAQGFDRLEFTDGLNIVTLNLMRRWQGESRWVPYAGAGIGAAIPHVEITTGSGKTYGYQVTGPAVQWVVGARYDTGPFSPFVEYKGTYSWNEADHGTGTLSTDLATHALNIGLSWRF